MLDIFLIIIHIMVCVVLIMVVLLQSGKAADLAGAFGGGGSQTALGSRGAATVLTKATTIAAVVFMFTSLILAIRGSRTSGSVLEQAPAPISAPGTPEGGAPGTQGAAPAEPAGGETESGKTGSAPPAGEAAPAPSPVPR